MDSDSLAGEVKEIYANFGLAIYQAQCLEHGIVNALVFLDLIPNQRRSAESASEWAQLVDSFMESRFEFTLGKMIRGLEEVTTVDPHLQDQLSIALKKRNWLAHGYFRDRAETFLTRAGRAEMLIELEDAQTIFSQADAALEAAIKPARQRAGLTDEVLAATYAKLRVEVGE
ncbi:hypothetical protein [[Pseudomonas] boreopolis]|uniref:hypothetical protein n=1 Tax=Xanthomonas boreopolis TaxID=86183 RepID=UPI003D9B4733